MKLQIAYLYKNELNLYGDNGNIEILLKRCRDRDIDAEVLEINIDTDLSKIDKSEINFVFMGGGPDAAQKDVYEDLLKNKKEFLFDLFRSNVCGLFVCGSYQLLGNYYKSADGFVLDGLRLFDVYTQHFGNHEPRCIGNVVCKINEDVFGKSFSETAFGNTLVGFENHGGRTFLGEGVKPFAKVVQGSGNNSQDFTEGCVFNNFIGTYLHGPILSKNPHFADYLIAKSLKIDSLPPISDDLILEAHLNAKNLQI